MRLYFGLLARRWLQLRKTDTTKGARPASYSYDADGALTSIYAPVTAQTTTFTLDRRKLPTQVGVPGVGTTSYRYSASGERFWKSVPGVGAEYYVLGPAATGREQQIGVFTGTTGSTLRHWNILTPSGEPVGRILASGARQYYAKDHLGSTRAVVNESRAF